MEKECIKLVTVQRAVHEFYCDICGEKLGESEGYYEKFGYYAQDIAVVDPDTDLFTIFKLRQTLCKACAERKTSELVKLLVDFGFKEDI